MTSKPPQRIVVRGVNWLGDAVMSTPALLRLREARPDAHITLVTHEKLKSLWPGHPAINAILTFAPDESAWHLGRRLRAEKFDLGLILPNSPRSALEFWFADIPERIGYARPWRNWFLTRPIPPRAQAAEMHKRSVDEINRLIRESDAPDTPPRKPQDLVDTHDGRKFPPLPSGEGRGEGPAGANVPSVAQNSFSPAAHHIHQYLHLTAALGASMEPVPPRLAVSDEALRQFIARPELGGGPSSAVPWFGLNAGAEYGPAKRWPEDRFAEAAIQIQRRARCRWLIFGVRSEFELATRIARNISQANENILDQAGMVTVPPVVNLAGATNLAELCAALKLCRVLLTNDSGPMHIAAALGTPVVVPFGSTSPELTGPGLPGDARHACLRAEAPCSPCFLRECPIDFRCMTGITVERVIKAVLAATS
jgi:ADP-heptose:LPS heptosyltransferase